MRGTKKLAAAGMLMLALYLLPASGLWDMLSEGIVQRLGEGRMRNVTAQTQEPLPKVPTPTQQWMWHS